MGADARVVIVGAGHGGAAVAGALRSAGHVGELVLIGAEPLLPYHRPPLSKAYLKGEAGSEPQLLRSASWYANNTVELMLGVQVDSIDAAARRVRLSDGREVAWEVLVLATGSHARRLGGPGAELDGVVVLRDMADARALAAHLGAGKRLAIIGAGYVGLEVAASARAIGAEVTVIEREPRILSRVACEELSGFFHRYHAERGVRFLTGASVAALHGEGSVAAVELVGGERIACDAVLVGIGGMPCDALAVAAGVQCDGGVVVDAAARTSVPGIYAVGDLTRRPMPHYAHRLFRLESVPNATDQARAAAAAIVGKPLPTPELPWFWSDQYDLKLQIAGVPFDADRRVVRGSLDEGNSFSIWHLSEGRVVAVEAVNAAGDFVAGKKLITAEVPVDPAALADKAVPLKAMLPGVGAAA